MEVQIKVPIDQSEITLGQYQRFMKLLEVNEDDLNEDFIALKILEIFCGVPYMEGMKFDYTEVRSIADKISDIINREEPFVQNFTMGSIQFGFIPKLDEISFGEYVDLDENLGKWENMHKTMAILYRPISRTFKDRYQVDEYTGLDLAESMRHMPLNAALGAMVFFYHLSRDLAINIQSYLKEEMQRNQVQNFPANGDGIIQFTEQLGEMLRGLKISLR